MKDLKELNDWINQYKVDNNKWPDGPTIQGQIITTIEGHKVSEYYCTPKSITEEIQKLIDFGNKFIPNFQDGVIRDEYHSFDDLYAIRLAYNVALFNEWGKHYKELQHLKDDLGIVNLGDIATTFKVHKSWKHNDGEWCFGKEKKWFIVSAMLPSGLISNHYKAEHWDLFKIPEVPQAIFEFDGHTSADVIKRLKDI